MPPQPNKRAPAAIPASSTKRVRTSPTSDTSTAASPSTPPSPLESTSPHPTSDDTESDADMQLSDIDADSSGTSTPAAGGCEFDWQDNTAFDPEECTRSRFPLFAKEDIVTRAPLTTPTDDKTKAELDQLTFHEWLDYFCRHPSFKRQRSFLYSDQQYTVLLALMVKGGKVKQFADDSNNLLEGDWTATEWSKWLWHVTAADTFKWQLCEYRGETVADITS